MKEIYASDIREGESVEALFLVKSKNLALGKTGKHYLVIALMDKTGEIEGRVWDDAEALSARFEAEDFVKVRGKVSAYMGKLQIKINNISKIDDDSVDIGDFLPTSAVPSEEMFGDLLGIAEGVDDPYVKKLLASLLDDVEIVEPFKRAPAAKGMHHVYVGGLLEHTLSICRLINMVSDHYGEKVNRSLLIAGAIFHDIGKIREMSYSRAFGYTDEGRLLGHITIGVEIATEKISTIAGFPEELALLIKHMIISHHGEYEYGSPKRPKTLEATILSYVDDLDAKVNSIQTLIDGENGNSTKWTGYHRLFERYIYKGNCLDPAGEARDASEKEINKETPKNTDQGETLALFGN